ncbi:MAG: ABA4-like family protein [Vicinamibacterales bacterium]
MSPELLFSLANGAALLGWLGLAVSPLTSSSTRVVSGLFVPGLLAVLYSILIASAWLGSTGGFGSLAEVAKLFSNPWLLLAGWVHYLAFDLLVGAWEVDDARRHKVPHALVLPCLVLTFLFGPAGWLLYQGMRRTFGAPASSVPTTQSRFTRDTR